jgi:hypothetical protein
MSFAACRPGLLSPTQWFAITFAIATAVNLREERTTLLVMKAMVSSSLGSAWRFFPTLIALGSKQHPRLFS